MLTTSNETFHGAQRPERGNMAKWKLFTIVALCAVVIIAVMIFCFSAQQGEDSSVLSRKITMFIIRTFHLEIENMTPAEWAAFKRSLDHVVRKVAHFTEYAMLGLAMTAFLGSTQRFGLGVKLAILSFVLCALYAVGDEIHQRFVVDRGPAALDVLIDSAGALGGDLLGLVLYRRHERRKAGRMAQAKLTEQN